MNEAALQATEILRDGWNWFVLLLTGPLGGVVGGIISFAILDFGWKRVRDRHQLAEALAAELSNNADSLEALLEVVGESSEIISFEQSQVVFSSVASQLGVLEYRDIAAVAKVYSALARLGEVRDKWERKVAKAEGEGDRYVRAHLALERVRVAKDYYRNLGTMLTDCRELATGLRTAYPASLKLLIPRRFRPKTIATSVDQSLAKVQPPEPVTRE